MWNNCKASAKHFTRAKQDKDHHNSAEQAIYECLLEKLTSDTFILDLGLLCDAQQELSELILELQSRGTTNFMTYQKIQSQIQFFANRKFNTGSYYAEAKLAVNDLEFKGVALHNTTSRTSTASITS